MNELKLLLMHIALNIKVDIRNVILKVFLEPEVREGVNEVYFLFRIDSIKSLENNLV